MKLPEDKLWDIDFFELNEFVDAYFANDIDDKYYRYGSSRYDVLTINWKSEKKKRKFFPGYKTIKTRPTSFVFARSQNPSKHGEEWIGHVKNPEYLELKEQIQTHINSRHE